MGGRARARHSAGGVMACARIALGAALLALVAAAPPVPIPDTCPLPDTTRDNILRYATKVDKIIKVSKLVSGHEYEKSDFYILWSCIVICNPESFV